MKKSPHAKIHVPIFYYLKWLFMIKLTVFILMTFSTSLLASESKAQGIVSSRYNEISLKNLLSSIEEQTEMSFIYNDNLIRNIRIKNVDVYRKPWNEVLLPLLTEEGLTVEQVKNNRILIRKRTEGQELIASGVITNAQGQVLPSVSVQQKGSTRATVSNSDGQFSLLVSNSGAVLEFTSIGYLSQALSYKQGTMHVVMQEDMSQMEEVVVVGYGMQKKINLSGAVDQIDQRFLENRPITNVGTGLQGAMANLNITPTSGSANSAPGINVRGFTSLSGGGPLIVIDGVPATNEELNRMNPLDIATVTVLKDAASAAIYGSRAAFGVILVTTKTGTSDKVAVSANSLLAMKGITRTIDVENDPYKVMTYRNIMAAPWYNLYDEKMLEYGKQLSDDPSLPRVIVDPQNPNNYIYLGSTDWFREVYKSNQPAYTNNVSISQKTDRSSYYVSGEYYRQDGMLRISPDTYDRYNFRVKGDYKLLDWLTLSTNTAYTNDKYDQPTAIDQGYLYWHNVNRQASLNMVYNPDGSYTAEGANMIGSVADGGRSVKRVGDIQLNFGTKVDLLKNIWTLNADATFRRTSTTAHRFDFPLDYSTGPGISYTQSFNSFASNSSGQTRYNVYNIYSQFHKTVNDHYFSVMLGFNQEERIYESFNASRDMLISNSLPTIQLATGEIPSVGASNYDWAVRGTFARLNYIFKDKYILESNLRYDGTSRFPKQDRFAFNPSVSGAWVVSSESFFKPLENVVSNAKLRASYGSLANQDLRDNYYPYIATMSKGSGIVLDGKRPPVVFSPGLVSSSLTWETITSTNFGLDLGLLSNKISISGDVYWRYTKDMLTAGQTLPVTLGTGVPLENAADLKTRGWELTLGYNDHYDVKGKPLQFSARFNLSDSRAFIQKFNNPKNNLSDYYVGGEIGDIWGLTTLGFFQTAEEIKNHADQTAVTSYPGTRSLEPGDLKFADLNDDGKIDKGDWTLENPGDYKIIGNNRQRYNFGLDLSSSWNGFDLRVFLQGVGKRHYYPGGGDHYFWGVYAQPWASLTKFNLDHWTPENPNAYLPRPKSYVAEQGGIELAAPQTKYLQNAGYLRVKNVTVGYTLPQSLVSRWGVDRVRVFLSGENLMEFTSLMKYLDPEIVGDRTAYPFQRTYSMGFNFNF